MYVVVVFPKVELTAGCHLARAMDGDARLQKGLRLRFLESHFLKNISWCSKRNQVLINLNSEDDSVDE